MAATNHNSMTLLAPTGALIVMMARDWSWQLFEFSLSPMQKQSGNEKLVQCMFFPQKAKGKRSSFAPCLKKMIICTQSQSGK